MLCAALATAGAHKAAAGSAAQTLLHPKCIEVVVWFACHR